LLIFETAPFFCKRHVYNILYIVSTPTCFNASASPSGSLDLVLAQGKKLLKLQLNESSRLKSSLDRCCMIKSIKFK
jgi:hypothetical protein